MNENRFCLWVEKQRGGGEFYSVREGVISIGGQQLESLFWNL
jgi:hypothetical protein